MNSTFFGLNIGVRGMTSQQRALEVTGHNIANANTKGFTRQEAVMATTIPIKTNQGFIGTGVEISTIRRIRDDYLDLQVRTENKAMGYWDFKSDILNKVEVVFNEPSDAGLRSTLDKFWSAWEDLSRKPESSAIRTTVIETGRAVVETFTHMERQLTDLRGDIDESINVYTDELNAIARQIKDLNYTIVKAEGEGHKANDLRDQRDLLLDEMSQIVDIDVVESSNGAVAVTIGGRAIVNGNVVNELITKKDLANDGYSQVTWFDGAEIKLREAGGKLKAMFEARDDLLKDKYLTNLDAMAKSLAEAINTVHSSGYHIAEGEPQGGIPFFVVTDSTSDFSARNLAINQALVDDVNLLAAATYDPNDYNGIPGIIGDGSNALQIAQLKYDRTVINGTTLDDFYQGETAKLGIDTREANRMKENQELLIAQLENKREMVMGVSLDEEMTNMIRFQHAYNSAARYITTIDGMLDTIVNRLGLVGR